MQKSETQSFITNSEILTKRSDRINKDLTTIFTGPSAKHNGEFVTIVRLNRSRRSVWSMRTKSTQEALRMHVAVIKMAETVQLPEWTSALVQEYLPQQPVTQAQPSRFYVQSMSLKSSYAKTLFKNNDLNITSLGLSFNLPDTISYQLLATCALLGAALLNMLLMLES